MPSLSDYFAQRQPEAGQPEVALGPTDDELLAEERLRRAEGARRDLAANAPFAAGISQGVSSLGDSLTAAKGLGQAALGYEKPAVATLRRAQQQMQDTAQYTPENAGTLTDAYSHGNLGTYASFKLGSLLPGVAATVVPAVATGGLGGLIQGGLRRAVMSEAADAVAARTVGRLGAETVLKNAGINAAKGESEKLARNAVRNQFMDRAIARNPSRFGAIAGETFGAGASGAVLAAPSQVDDVLNDPGDGSTLQERAQKGIAATGVQGAIAALPTLALLNRYGLGATAEKAIAARLGAPLLKRLAREGGEQGAIGGASAVAAVAAQRATHQWITNHPSAAPALPEYINALADGALGGAVFGAPAGFRGNRGAIAKLRAKVDALGTEFTKASRSRPQPGEPVAPDGSADASRTVNNQFADALASLREPDTSHFDKMFEGVEPYNAASNGDGISATMSGPFGRLVDPQRFNALATAFKDPVKRLFASLVATDRLSSDQLRQVTSVSKMFKQGKDSLGARDKANIGDFINDSIDPAHRDALLTALATADAHLSSGLDLRKASMTDKGGKPLMEADPFQNAEPVTTLDANGVPIETTPGRVATPKPVPTENVGPFANVDPTAERSLSHIPDEQWTAAQFRSKPGGPARRSPAEENVKLIRTAKSKRQYDVDLNMMRAASALSRTAEGGALISGGAHSRKVNAAVAIIAEAKFHGDHIASSEIREGLRIFPGKDGKLTAAEANTIKSSFARARKEPKSPPPLGETVPKSGVSSDRLSMQQERVGKNAEVAEGDLQGVTDREAQIERAGGKIKGGDDRAIENTVRSLARGLPIDASSKRTPGQLYEDALHVGGNAKMDQRARALRSVVRQLSENDATLARHMEEADQRKAIADFTGERLTGDNGALIPWRKALLAGKKPTKAQREAFLAIRERTHDFASMSAKASAYADDLAAKLRAKKAAGATPPRAGRTLGRESGDSDRGKVPRSLTEAAVRVKAVIDSGRPNLKESQLLHQWLVNQIDTAMAAGRMDAVSRYIDLDNKLGEYYSGKLLEASEGFPPEQRAALEKTIRDRIGDLVDIAESTSIEGSASGDFSTGTSTKKPLITLYSTLSRMYETNPTKTALHEVGHAAMSLFEQTLGRERALKLVKLADTPEINRQLRESAYSEKQYEYFMASPEERFVEAYAQWAVGDLKLSPASPARGFFAKLKAFFAKLRGDMTLEQAFKKIDSGDLAKGPPIDSAKASARISDKRFITYDTGNGAEQSLGGKETVGSINKEITDADQYARNPPKDFTAEQAAKLEARMREVSERAKARRDALGEEHDHYQTFDDIRMNAKDAANALKEVIANDKAAREVHPDWFDKDVPLAEQTPAPKGPLRTSIEAIQKTSTWKALTKRVDVLRAEGNLKMRFMRESTVLRDLSKSFGVKTPKLAEHTSGPAGRFSDNGVLSLRADLTGPARMSAMLHEFGHHLVNEKFKGATPETKAALIADYKAWRRAQGDDALETRLSRAPFFRSLGLIEALGDRAALPRSKMTTEQAKYLMSFHEYLADNIARALEQHEPTQTLIGRFMSKLAQVVKLAYDLARGHDARLTDPPASVRDWVQSLYEAAHEQASTEPSAAGASPATAAGGAPRPAFTEPSDATSVLPPAERGILRDFFTRRGIMEQLLTGADEATVNALGSVDTQMTAAINRGFALWAAGKLKFVDKRVLAPLNALRDAIMKVFGIATKDELAARILKDLRAGNVTAGYSARGIHESEVRAGLRSKIRAGSKTAEAQLAVRKGVAATSKLVTKKLEPVYHKVLSDLDGRMRATNIPQLIKLAALVHLQTGERSARGTVPMTQAIKQTQAQYWDKVTQLAGNLTLRQQAKILKALRTKSEVGDPALDARRQAILAHFKEMREYLSAAGVEMGTIEDYFPVVVDPRKVQNRTEAFKAMLSDPKLEEPMKRYFRKQGWNTKDMTQLDMIDAMHRMAASEFDYSLGGHSFANGISPGGKEFRTRVSEFIYSTKDADLINQFAKFQSGNLEQVMLPYVTHAVRRAEFTRRLGVRDEGVTALETMLDAARGEGATPEQIQLAKDFVDASLGAYGTGANPFFKKVLGSFDRVFDTKLSDINSAQYRKLSNAIIAYQNMRVLGLGLFGNMIDPLGVWVRSSSASGTWQAYREAYKAMGKANPSYLRDMAHALGTVERHATGEALAYNYGGTGDDLHSVSARINRTLFRVNGMETITNFARLAATEMGNKFLLMHARRANKHSERYLADLRLKPSDIVEDPQHPGYVKRTPKIDAALYRFVDESVLRPVATQRPLWHSDPHFAIAAQYKGYLYSFYNTIVRRMIHEAKNGNIQGLAPMAAYIGVTMAAELARELVQYGGDGNPNRKNWDTEDYFEMVVDRTGLTGPRFGAVTDSLQDFQRGNVPGQAIAGPTVSQASGLVKTLRGRQSVESTLVQALPGQSIYRGYLSGDNNNESQESAEPAAARTQSGT